ncbi:MAG: ABC transporter permease [Pseudomonadota bacterium]
MILWRSWRTTLVLSFMVIASVAALVFLSALAVGTNDAMIRNSTGLFSGHIAGGLLREEDISLLQVEGVGQVLLRRQQHVLLGKHGLLEPLVLTGVDPVREKEATAFWKKTVAGRYPAPGEDEIFLSQGTAERLDLAVGDTVAVADRQAVFQKELTVAGIYKTGITHLDQGLAFCPTGALPPGESGISVAVFLKSGVPVETIVAQYRRSLPSATFAAWPEFMPDLRQLIDLEFFCMAIVIILIFAIVSLGISCIFLIFTLKNLREHGMMKAMGLLSGDTALLLVAQIGLLTCAAATVGALAGMLMVAVFSHSGIDISAFTTHNQYFSVSGILYPRLTGPALFAPPGVAIVFGLVAAIWPIVYVTCKNPADILRSV